MRSGIDVLRSDSVIHTHDHGAGPSTDVVAEGDVSLSDTASKSAGVEVNVQGS